MFLSRPTKKYIRKRPSRRSVGSAVKFNRRIKFQIEIEMEQDSIETKIAPDGTIFRVLNKLGPQGKFFLASIVIAMIITALSIIYQKQPVQLVVGAEQYSAAQIMAGKSIYQANCAFCHGDNLEGKMAWNNVYKKGGRPPTPLNDSGEVSYLSNADLFDIVKYGGQPFSPLGYKNNMPGFEMQLDDARIWEVIYYIKSRSTKKHID
jgi:mono/diheme cytochrome c family protein